jgi:uncharacterized protein involved in cysteine biosynthesis
MLGLGVALLLVAPVLERLSRKAEEHVRVPPPGQRTPWRWEMAQSFKSALYFLAAAPVVLLLSLVPVVGAVAGLAWGAHALAVQETDLPLTRRGFDFRGRLRWLRRFLAESLGFGVAGLVLMVVPCANFLLAPALTVGATLMVLELDEQLSPIERSTLARGPRGPKR